MRRPWRRVLNYVYAYIRTLILSDYENGAERLREFDNFLRRPPLLESALLPGLPIPAWMDDSDIPPDSLRMMREAPSMTNPVQLPAGEPAPSNTPVLLSADGQWEIELPG